MEWNEVFRKGVENTTMTGVPRFFELLKLMGDTHEKKNSDYATESEPLKNLISSEKYFNLSAPTGVAVRMADKWDRFCNILQKGSTSVENESIKDTLLDLANYCLLEIIIIERDEQRGNTTNRNDSTGVSK